MQYFLHFLRGLAMGAANVIPGVSGGTIALLTGIFERLINALKSFDLKAVQLLRKGQVDAFCKHTDCYFLAAVGAGVVVSILSLAKMLEHLLATQQIYTMAFFFGLIIASVWFVGKSVRKWSLAPSLACAIGCGIAVAIALLRPAGENDSFLYLMLCGAVAICSMILPGLSGSFVLLIMGNYVLVLRGIYTFDFGVLVPVAVGCAVGVIAFAWILSWVLKRWHNITLALMTGFITGSLAIIWPWKGEITRLAIIEGRPKEILIGYDYYLPNPFTLPFWTAIGLIIAGALAVWLMEKLAAKKPG